MSADGRIGDHVEIHVSCYCCGRTIVHGYAVLGDHDHVECRDADGKIPVQIESNVEEYGRD